MDMELYNYTGDRRVLNKNMTYLAKVIILDVTDTTSILTPTILIDTRAINFNYVYIADWNRYYYVTNIDMVDGERLAVRLKCDVLMSHRDAINRSQIIAKRSASAPNAYIPDAVCGDEGTIETIYRNVSNTAFNSTGSYLLTIAGK